MTLTYTSSNCILPAHDYVAKVTRLLSKRVWRVKWVQANHQTLSQPHLACSTALQLGRMWYILCDETSYIFQRGL